EGTGERRAAAGEAGAADVPELDARPLFRPETASRVGVVVETGATGSRAGRLEAVVVAAAATALTGWGVWPLAPSPAPRAAYDTGVNGLGTADFHLIVWALAWDAHALVHDPLHLFHANIFHPSTLSLAYSEHFLGYVPIFAPVYWATGNAILAVNVVVFSSYPMAAVGAYLLARRFTSAPGAAVAGFFYAFCPWRYLSSTHLHMLGVAWLPLALLFTERWLESARARDAVLLAVALVLQALSSLYLAYA